MTQKDLESLCREWQKRLRLQDWNIAVKLLRQYDMPPIRGSIDWTYGLKAAVIRVLDPIDYDPSWVDRSDPEQTLIHELLHLHFACLDPDQKGSEQREFEQGVELIAMALFDLKQEMRRGVPEQSAGEGLDTSPTGDRSPHLDGNTGRGGGRGPADATLSR